MDYFALLNEPRRPWLDEELLKAKFLELSSEVHPDRIHGAPEGEKQRANQRFADLNSAYHCLREPKTRLQRQLRLVALEQLGEEGGRIAPGGEEEAQVEDPRVLGGFDARLGGRDPERAAGAARFERELRVEHLGGEPEERERRLLALERPPARLEEPRAGERFERSHEWTDKLTAVQRRLNAEREALAAELKQMNPAWEEAPASGEVTSRSLPLGQLQKVGSQLGYLTRWAAQIQERVVQLAL